MALSSPQPVSCHAAQGLSALNPLCCWQAAQIPQAALSLTSCSSIRAHRCPLFGHFWAFSSPDQAWLLTAPQQGSMPSAHAPSAASCKRTPLPVVRHCAVFLGWFQDDTVSEGQGLNETTGIVQNQAFQKTQRVSS